MVAIARFYRSLRNDNTISRQQKIALSNSIVMAFSRKNNVFERFPLCPEFPPCKNSNYITIVSPSLRECQSPQVFAGIAANRGLGPTWPNRKIILKLCWAVCTRGGLRRGGGQRENIAPQVAKWRAIALYGAKRRQSIAGRGLMSIKEMSEAGFSKWNILQALTTHTPLIKGVNLHPPD